MEKPLVSVVVPIYNMEPFLNQTIDSILKSTYANIEIILFDDESTDNSFAIAQTYADKYPFIRTFKHSNAGASATRNAAIREANADYILPVDADNLISENYIEDAVNVLINNPQIKVVSCEALFFGEKTGKWKFPKFSYKLLARKNMIDNCAMYRKKHWQEAGGYCEYILGREDWDFWIAMFKHGGEFLRLPNVGLHYRVRSNSKRRKTQNRKKLLIDAINKRHKPFIYRQLNGPLHYKRTWSKTINTLHNIIAKNAFLIYTDNSDIIERTYLLPETWQAHQGRDKWPIQIANNLYILSDKKTTKRNTKAKQELINCKLRSSNITHATLLGTYRKYNLHKNVLNIHLLQLDLPGTLITLTAYLKENHSKENLLNLRSFINQLTQSNIVCSFPDIAIAVLKHKDQYHFIVIRPDLCQITNQVCLPESYFDFINKII